MNSTPSTCRTGFASVKPLLALLGLAFGAGVGCDHLPSPIRGRQDRAEIARLPSYTVRDLGPALTGFPLSAPDFGLNNNGQVVVTRRKADGTNTVAFFDPANPATIQEWSLPGSAGTLAGGGHKNGWFAVTATINRPASQGGPRTQGGPFRGVASEFLTPVTGFDDCRAVDRTEDRIFVGESTRREANEIVNTASIWWGANKTDIGAEMAAQNFSPSSSRAMQINSQNTVVGMFVTGEPTIANRHRRAWIRFANGSLRQDMAQTLPNRMAFSVNDANVVAGGDSAAWVWSPVSGATTLLPGKDGNLPTQGAHSINSNGTVVGAASFGGQHGFSASLWRATRYRPEQGQFIYARPTDLNTVASVPDGFHLFSAVRINDSGQILCFGLKDSEQRAFLLTPRFTIR